MALEACISLTLFLIAMVALYSLINMFTAQSMISHALQQTGQSIALENYKNSKTDVKTLQKLPLSLLQSSQTALVLPVTQSMMSAEGPSQIRWFLPTICL